MNLCVSPGVAPTATPDSMLRVDREPACQVFRNFLATTTEHWRVPGADRHAVVLVDGSDASRGTTRHLDLQIPVLDRHGALGFEDRQFDVRIPKGVFDGQQLRLRGAGAPGLGGAPAGDLYLDVLFLPLAS